MGLFKESENWENKESNSCKYSGFIKWSYISSFQILCEAIIKFYYLELIICLFVSVFNNLTHSITDVDFLFLRVLKKRQWIMCEERRRGEEVYDVKG